MKHPDGPWIAYGPDTEAIAAAFLKHGGKVRHKLPEIQAVSGWMPAANLEAFAAEPCITEPLEEVWTFRIPSRGEP